MFMFILKCEGYNVKDILRCEKLYWNVKFSLDYIEMMCIVFD